MNDYNIEGVQEKANEVKNKLLDIAYELLDRHEKITIPTDEDIRHQSSLLANQKFLNLQYKALVSILKDMKKLSPTSQEEDIKSILSKMTKWESSMGKIQQKIN